MAGTRNTTITTNHNKHRMTRYSNANLLSVGSFFKLYSYLMVVCLKKNVIAAVSCFIYFFIFIITHRLLVYLHTLR